MTDRDDEDDDDTHVCDGDGERWRKQEGRKGRKQKDDYRIS